MPTVEGAQAWLMYATQGPEGGRFGGLQGALTVDATLMTDSGMILSELRPDALGQFSVAHDVPAGGQLKLRVGGQEVAFRVRAAEVALKAAVHAPVGGVGAVPNDLIPLGSGEESYALVVRSGDNAVSPVDWQDGLRERGGVRLPSVPGVFGALAAGPWMSTALDAVGERVAVSASLQGSIYILNISKGTIETTLQLDSDVVLDAPFMLPAPFDVDGDGTNDSSVFRFRPTTPQPLAVMQGRLLVAYASVLRADLGNNRPQIVLPAVVASFDLANLDAPPVLRVLPRLNPQEIRPSDGGALVTCSGTFRIQGVQAVSPGAVFLLDPITLQTLQQRDFDEFLPTTAIELQGRVWVGSLGRSWVESFDWADPESRTQIPFSQDEVASVFRLLGLAGGLLGVPSFNSDRIHIIDPRTSALNPEPFYGPLQVGPGGLIFDGLQIVARRPGRAGLDFVGPDLLVLSGVASRLTPVELRKILGP